MAGQKARSAVFAPEVPAIHALLPFKKTWMPGTGPGMTAERPRWRVMARMKQGNLSNVKPVGGGVLECRIDFGPGYRIYFGRDGETLVILLTGGSKKRQQRDIEAAFDCWQDYKRRARNRR